MKWLLFQLSWCEPEGIMTAFGPTPNRASKTYRRSSGIEAIVMPGDKVLVTCATGKAGLECCRALVDAGFDVYGTSRTSTGGKKISAVGA